MKIWFTDVRVGEDKVVTHRCLAKTAQAATNAAQDWAAWFTNGEVSYVVRRTRLATQAELELN